MKGISNDAMGENLLYLKTVTPRLGPTHQSAIEQLGRETNHSPQTSAELKNKLSSYFHSHLCLHRQLSVRIKRSASYKSDNLQLSLNCSSRDVNQFLF